MVVLAGALAGLLLLDHPRVPRAGVVNDGPTFYEALETVNLSVATEPGGPWVLSQVVGVASPVPTYPSAWGWGSYDDVLASCQPAFNGLTIWNGSIPLFNGTFNSGTAPFWQFMYFSNESAQLLVGTDLEGMGHVYPPIALTSPCAVSSDLGYQPWRSAWTFDRFGFPANTPVLAATSWSVVGQQFVQWLGTAPTEMFLMGDLQFGSGQPFGVQTSFFTCGTAGGVGVTRGLDVFVDPNDTARVALSYNYTLGCTPTTNNWTPIDLQLQFANSGYDNSTGTTALSQTFRFEETGPSPYLGAGYNERGITSWMTRLNLSTGTGAVLPVGTPECSAWIPSMGDCGANATGWYAVLLSPSGEWEGTYGAQAGVPGWNEPVLPIANNETFVLVFPSSWDLAGDSFEATSITSELPMTGSVALPE
ncbi:MAG TPA: hypothetical protein VMG81_02060 [Thermoplasmata archaeon]|nr:hypothetical protein [Thermoplasmata archaeon]